MWIRQLLGAQADPFMRFYGVTQHGNFERKNVLFVPHPDKHEWETLASAREILRAAREARPHPLRDDKILTSWNGLTISAMALAADFVIAALGTDGRLHRSWKDGWHPGPASSRTTRSSSRACSICTRRPSITNPTSPQKARLA